MKKLVATLIMLSLVALAGCGSTKPAANTNASAPSQKKVLKVGSEITYAPFEFKDDKENNTGFDLELITEIGKAAGFDEVKIENVAWDGLIPSLESGKIDLVAAAMTITDERKQAALFSDRYFQSTQYIAVKEGSTIKSAADLKGKKVGVQTNTTGQTVAEKAGVTSIKKFDTIPDALNALKIGAVDAVVADSPVVLWFIKQNPDAKIISLNGDFDKEYFGMAMKLGNQELATKINDGLKKVKDNGKYKELYKKYFNVDAPQF
jgi:ABC-type amino acid transport substrate-binding protein